MNVIATQDGKIFKAQGGIGQKPIPAEPNGQLVTAGGTQLITLLDDINPKLGH